MMEFYELLKKIQHRPAMYLGRRSLSHLYTFLEGYTFARREAKIPVTEEEKDFENFQEWVEERLGQPDTQSWSRIILFYSEDETDALNRFFELLEEFLQRNQTLNADEIARVQSRV